MYMFVLILFVYVYYVVVLTDQLGHAMEGNSDRYLLSSSAYDFAWRRARRMRNTDNGKWAPGFVAFPYNLFSCSVVK